MVSFFEDGLDDDYENVDWNTVNKYGSGEIDENGYLHFRLHYFQPNIESDWNNYDLDLLEELNQMEEIIEVFLTDISALFSRTFQFKIFFARS